MLAGHSLGSTYVAHFARRDRARGTDARRVVGVVLLDPVACLLHQAKTTAEFVFNSLYTLEDATMVRRNPWLKPATTCTQSVAVCI